MLVHTGDAIFMNWWDEETPSVQPVAGVGPPSNQKVNTQRDWILY